MLVSSATISCWRGEISMGDELNSASFCEVLERASLLKIQTDGKDCLL